MPTWAGGRITRCSRCQRSSAARNRPPVRLEAPAVDVDAPQASLVEHRLRFVRVAVNELGAKFDRLRKSRFAMGQDAPADAISRFENGNAQTGIVQISRRGKPGRTGADDDDVGA